MKKSWKIEMHNKNGVEGKITAVDAKTNEFITQLMEFGLVEDGNISTTPKAMENLEAKGYDPHEHGHDFTDEGSIWVETN